jgi:hypothetical protein
VVGLLLESQQGQSLPADTLDCANLRTGFFVFRKQSMRILDAGEALCKVLGRSKYGFETIVSWLIGHC